MTVWLGQQEAVAQFRAYLDYVRTLDPSHGMVLTKPMMIKTMRWKKQYTQPYHPYHLLLILLPSNCPSLTQTSTLSLQNSKPPILFWLLLHTFVALFLLLLFLFFPTLWITSTFTSVSQSIDLQTQQLDFQNLWIKSVQHLQFWQKAHPRQYHHIMILCWCMKQTLVRISIPKGHA